METGNLFARFVNYEAHDYMLICGKQMHRQLFVGKLEYKKKTVLSESGKCLCVTVKRLNLNRSGKCFICGRDNVYFVE